MNWHRLMSIGRTLRISVQVSSAQAVFLLPIAFVLGVFIPPTQPARAQEQPDNTVQELTGDVGGGNIDYYVLPDLQQGQTIFVYVESTTGNLDPFAAVVDADFDSDNAVQNFRDSFEQAVADGREVVAAITAIADELFLAWNDDSGTASNAVLSFVVPADGTYQLLVASSPFLATSGEYRLLIGLDVPAVATGQAEPAGEPIAFPGEQNVQAGVFIEERTDTLSTNRRTTRLTLRDVSAGDTLYLFIEATSGDLVPMVLLEDFRTKPLASSNFSSRQSATTLEYTFSETSSQNKLQVVACCQDGPVTAGDYRLLIGINAPEVLSGQADSTSQPVLTSPIPVQVGLRMDQITDVDQTAENFGVVADLRVEWTDPDLAFNPDSCQCVFKTIDGPALPGFLSTQGIDQWPDFTVFNQQGRRDSQGELAVVRNDGHVIYVERFSVTLQAPDFDFRLFPFDTQQFYIRVRSVFPDNFFVYTELDGYSGIGEQLGEEEWIVTDYTTFVDTSIDSSRFNLAFTTARHLNFYIYRIFLPLLIIVAVSYAIFFLRDYGRRIEVASANLLLLIAFNFTISSDLPRLGYMTFMDVVLISAFVVTSMVLVLNVYLKRLELNGKSAQIELLDRFVIWTYPLGYILTIVIAFFWIRYQ